MSRHPTPRSISRTPPAVVAVLLLALPVAAGVPDRPENGHPGLRSFLSARMLEAEGRYQLAMEEYAESLEESPEVAEIRIRYASLLADMGMPERAVSLLRGRDDLDWYGQRVLAMALSRVATQEQDVLPEAAEALRQALAERPDDPTVQLALAQMVHRLGQVDEAAAIISGLRERHDGNPQLVLYHASLLRTQGRLEEAADVYRTCVDGPATAVSCREGLIQVLTELGRSGEAGEAILEWAADEDLDQLLRAASLLAEEGRLEAALGAVRRLLAREPGSPPAQRMEAELLVRSGRHEEAARRLRALLAAAPDDPGLLIPLAWVEARRGRSDEARRLIGRAWEAVEKRPDTEAAERVALAAARAELVLDSPGRAREWLERVDEPAGAGPEYVRLLAESYRRSRHWQEAVAAMLRLQPRLDGAARDEAVAYEAEFRLRSGDERRGRQRLQPLLEGSRPRLVLMAVQVLQGLERWEDVAEAAADAQERFPDNRELRFARAAALERLGRQERAAAIFQGLLDENPRDATAANYLGYMWADAGVNLEEALHLIGIAVELEPDNPAYLDSMGWVHFRLGNLEEARQWLQRALAKGAGGDGTVLSHLGQTLLALGDGEEAVPMLRRALELGCDDPDRVRELIDAVDRE